MSGESIKMQICLKTYIARRFKGIIKHHSPKAVKQVKQVPKLT